MKHQKKYLAMFTAAVIACSPLSAYAVTFADMNDVPWAGAENSIMKAANLDLMVGSEVNGKTVFRPKAAVSLCEVAQLSYKLMLNTGKITASSGVTEKWSGTLQANNIPSWAHTALAQCLEKNIVTTSDLSHFMSGNQTRQATREEAAAILGRTLAAVNSSLAVSPNTAFRDDAQIKADAKPYIGLLYSENVIKGDDQSNFNPKKTLNRTETAVMVTNLHGVMSNTAGTVPAPAPSTAKARTVSGVLTKVTNSYVNLRNDSGTYYFNAASQILQGTKAITIYDLEELVKNSYDMNAVIDVNASNYIEKITIASKDSTVKEASVTFLDDKKITVGGTSYTIKNVDDVKVTIDGSSKSFSKLLEVYKDSSLNMTATLTLDTSKYVTKVDAKTSQKGKTYTGIIKSLSNTKIKIDSTTYDIDDYDDVVVKIDGTTKTFSQLKDKYNSTSNLQATVTLDSHKYVSKIEVTTKSKTYSGTIKSLSNTKIKLDSTTYDIKDYDDVTVKIDGTTKTFSQLKDKYNSTDLTATVTLDSREYVTKIEATTKSKTYSGTVNSLSTSKIKIDSTTYDIYDIDDVTIKIDGTTKSYSKLKDAYNEETLTATITLDANRYVTKIDAKIKTSTKEVEGRIKSLSYSKIQIGSNTYTIDDYDDVTVKIDGSSKTFNKLKDLYDSTSDDLNATVTLNSKKYVTKIVVKTSSNSSSSSSNSSSKFYSGTVNTFNKSSIQVNGASYTMAASPSVRVEIYVNGSHQATVTSLNQLTEWMGEYNSFKADIEVKNGYVTSIAGTMEAKVQETRGVAMGTVSSLSSSSAKISGTSYFFVNSPVVAVDVYSGGSRIATATSIREVMNYMDMGVINFDVDADLINGKIDTFLGSLEVKAKDKEEKFSGTVSSISRSSMRIDGANVSISGSPSVQVYIYDATDDSAIDTARSMDDLLIYSGAMTAFEADVAVKNDKVVSISGYMDVFIDFDDSSDDDYDDDYYYYSVYDEVINSEQ